MTAQKTEHLIPCLLPTTRRDTPYLNKEKKPSNQNDEADEKPIEKEDTTIPVRLACPGGHHICWDCAVETWKTRKSRHLRCMHCRYEFSKEVCHKYRKAPGEVYGVCVPGSEPDVEGPHTISGLSEGVDSKDGEA